MVHKVQGCKTPVDAVEAKVFSEMVFELVFARVEGLDVFYVRGDRELQFSWERGRCG